jgi:Type II CAAX prenyl endopeptidase Rce1-like
MALYNEEGDSMTKLLAILCTALVAGFAVQISAQEKQALRLVQTIPLPGVTGRLDHMGVDLEQKRLFLAAVANNTLEVVDLTAGKVIKSLAGFTAGVCEETLFRGFLLHYLQVFPWTLNLTLALLISSVIFGFNHLYQGAGGVAGSAIVGFLFGLLFLLTGNLLLPIIFHGVIDLRMLAILRPPTDTPS